MYFFIGKKKEKKENIEKGVGGFYLLLFKIIYDYFNLGLIF